MTLPPVTEARIEYAASHGIFNAGRAALACRTAGLPFYAACALLEKESHGRNVYGHDEGGVFSNDEHETVDAQNFMQFIMRVMNGATSNGVGPCQITFAGSLKDGHRDGGYFRQMALLDLLPWRVYDNMVFGFSVLADHYERTGSWVTAGRLYNGKLSYGEDLNRLVSTWKRAILEAR